MDWPAEIRTAARRIGPHVHRTPVMTAGAALGLPGDVVLKLELFQHTGSFKPRGAFNTLLADPPPAGVTAASGGNHGAAVAYSAAQLGVPARIFVPEIAGPAKMALIRRTGADLVVAGQSYADALTACEAWQRETGATAIHAYDAPGTLAGQGTVAAELSAQAPDLDAVLVAVGGGGLIGGIAGWYDGNVPVIGVEPERAATLTNALAHGPETETEVSGIAANALGARRIGRLCHDIALAQRIRTVTVTDDAIADAQRRLWSGCRILAEPGGATALAALTSGALDLADARIGVIVCGANIDPDPLDAMTRTGGPAARV